jgi:hypothetical protein
MSIVGGNARRVPSLKSLWRTIKTCSVLNGNNGRHFKGKSEIRKFSGAASAHHVVGVPAEALRKRFREEFQRKKVGRAGNHAVAEQSGNKLSKFRHLGQTETGTVKTEGQEKTNQADRGPDTDRVGQSAQAIVV